MAMATIDRSKFEELFSTCKGYFLLCVQTEFTADEVALQTIEEISRSFPKTFQAYLANENYLDFFQDTCEFLGIPIYILFLNGKEQERLLGKVTAETIKKFLIKYLKEP